MTIYTGRHYFTDMIMGAPSERTCRICGCTDTTPCLVNGVPCWWVEVDLCSACEGKASAIGRRVA
jgi:hypothetical protein